MVEESGFLHGARLQVEAKACVDPEIVEMMMHIRCLSASACTRSILL